MTGYRGRLIQPFLIELRQLDLAGTAADPDGAGPLDSGFDPDFKEPVRVGGVTNRVEFEAIKVPCQVEEETPEQLLQRQAGNDPDYRLGIVFHFADLERLGLVTDDGIAKIHVNDRATAIYSSNGELAMRLDTEGPQSGLFCIKAEPRSFGLSGGKRNLLVCTFARRRKTA